MMPRWLPILFRVAAAVFGGYVLATLIAIVLAGVLPLSRADGVLSGMLAAFPIYAVAVMWTFAAKNVWQACFGLLGAVAVALTLAMLAAGAIL